VRLPPRPHPINTSNMASSSFLPRLILGAAIVFGVAAGGINLSHKSALEAVRKDAETQKGNADALVAQTKKATDAAKAASEKQKAADEAKVAAEAKAAAATAESDKAKKDAEDALAQVKAKEIEIADLKTKLPDPNATAQTAPTPDPAKEKELADAKARAAETETLLKTVQAKAEDADKKAAALEAAELARQKLVTKPGLEGKVLAVNPNWSFVVLSIGDRQGVVAGSSLIVKRGGNMVAKLRVTSVEPSTSIADIQVGTSAKGTTVQPGDVVIFPGS